MSCVRKSGDWSDNLNFIEEKKLVKKSDFKLLIWGKFIKNLTRRAAMITTVYHSKVVTGNVSYLLQPQQLLPLITTADDRSVVVVIIVIINIIITTGITIIITGALILARVLAVTVLVISSVLTAVGGVSINTVNYITANRQVKTPSLNAASIPR
ncbi:hypothetical protein KQX54_020278 [Cotesia glomerata]|uniref:Uncharacterized protein n=1 Tax=Cotesia glomerata TaxID=32391 RepID=A0AAV7IHM3_COTGL|nr:hypothetical protein KQX54_020278 [Cotesia glomerata]